MQRYTRRSKAETPKPAPQPESSRNSPAVRARRAATLLDNVELRNKFDEVRTQLVNDLELTQLDGSEAAANLALEKIRQLQALHAVKAQILQALLVVQKPDVDKT